MPGLTFLCPMRYADQQSRCVLFQDSSEKQSDLNLDVTSGNVVTLL